MFFRIFFTTYSDLPKKLSIEKRGENLSRRNKYNFDLIFQMQGGPCDIYYFKALNSPIIYLQINYK